MQRRLVIALAALHCGVAGCGGASDPVDTDGGVSDGQAIVFGQEFVAARACASCHQSKSAADGVLSGQTTVVPGTLAYGSNLTPDITTGLGAWADIEIVRAMRDGVDNQQYPLCPSMPRFDGSDPARPMMTDLEAYSIVAYLRSLPPVTRVDGGIPFSLCVFPDLSMSGDTLDLSVAVDMSPSSARDR